MAPLLKPGYILTLDMIFTPNMAFRFPSPSGLYSFLPLDLLLHLLAQIISADVIQKLILLFLFYLIPFGFFKFLGLFEKEKDEFFMVKIMASLLYLWNPFVYSRFLAGHWTFLFGYALLPLFVYKLVSIYRLKDLGGKFLKHLGVLILLSVVMTILSPHHLVFQILFFVAYSVFEFFQKTGGLKKFFIILISLLVTHSVWIVPSLLSNISVLSFGESDLVLFASSPDSQGTFMNLLTMYGFWAEKTLFDLPKAIISFWPLPFFLLFTPMIFLLFLYLPKYFRKILALKITPQANHKPLIVTLLILGLLGAILSLGSLGIAKPIFDLFYIRYPLLTGFREPQKFLSLYILTFCSFFYLGMKIWIHQIRDEKLESLEDLKAKEISQVRKFLEKSIIIGFFALIFCLTYTFFWGAFRQLQVASYPPSYEKLQDLTKDSNSKILVLPFESYDLFPFNNRRIANPADKYFNTEVIFKRELDELAEKKCDVSANFCLNKTDSSAKWNQTLWYSGVDYILINKSSDWRDYAFLSQEGYFEKIAEDDFSYVLKVLPQ